MEASILSQKSGYRPGLVTRSLTLSASLSLVLLIGCASNTANLSSTSSQSATRNLPDGAWVGPIATTGVNADDSTRFKGGEPMEETSQFMVTVCDGKSVFWAQEKNGRYRAGASAAGFRQSSNHGNHLIYFENYDRDDQPVPGWVEMQSMQLVELQSGALRAQWSRAVSNPLLPEGDSNRDFFWHGVGTLKRVAATCPREMMKVIM
jgi:hypothetical protein